jgi:LacI family transcriptional regulator
MQDIARKLNISRSTVSLVLSGKSEGRVSDAVREKVLQCAKDMNYHLNELARSLRVGSSKLISVIVTDISNEFFAQMTFHIQEAAKKAGYLVLTINSNESEEEFDQMARILISKHVDGIIAVPTPGGEDSLHLIMDQGVPLVTVDRLCEEVAVDYVGVDNYEAAKTAVRELIDEGFKNIIMMRLDLDIPPLNERERGYVDAMKEAGLGKNIDLHRIRFGEGMEEDLDKSLGTAIGSDAVFFTSHRVFTEAMKNVAKVGGVPKGQCVLCFDDVSPYMTGTSDIRYIEQPIADIAYKSFELLLAKMKGDTHIGRYIFPTRSIARKSILK